ncbi:MAG: hypothetical protein QOG41_1526 [Thermoleophilaceae bacterium]|jgi:hypothetical protein|nr:hypothetical protein [Thermoleophilaceae bacterium]
MGNLPRSRPGRRSDKRAGGAAGSGKAAGGSGGTKSKATRSTAKKASATARGSKAGATAARSSGSGSASARSTKSGSASGADTARPRPPVKTAPRGPDPVGDAVRVATKLAGAGLGIAAGVLKRLPRP